VGGRLTEQSARRDRGPADEGPRGSSEPGAADSRTRILSLDKAVTIMDVLDRASGGMQLAEISRHAGMNRSTAYRILSTLEANRIVMRDEHLRYRLGFRLFELGSAAKDHHVGFHEIAAVHLRHTAERLGVTGFLAVRDGERALYVEQAVYGDPHYVAYPAGRSLPLHIGAASRVLLAHASPDDVDQYLSGPLVALGPMSVTEPSLLRRVLEDVRRDGIAVTDGDVTPGLAACGAPVLDRSGAVVAAASVSALTVRVLGAERAHIAQAVRDLAGVISRELGWHGGR
jgi:DNA-binding IclR family transcriptional regulator